MLSTVVYLDSKNSNWNPIDVTMPTLSSRHYENTMLNIVVSAVPTDDVVPFLG